MSTLQELWNRYARIQKVRKKSFAQDEYAWDKYLSHHAKADAEQFAEDLPLFHSDLGEKHGKTLANNVCILVKTIYAKNDLPRPKFEKFKTHARERFLSDAERERFLKAAESSSIRDFVLVALFTGARSRNIREMRWEELDLEARTWTVPADKSKNGRVLRIHLIPTIVELLEARADELASISQWVFPQRRGNGSSRESGQWTYIDAPMARPSKSFERLLKAAGIEGLTIHDLRRSFGSALAAKYPLPIVAAALGHASLQSTAIYARLARATMCEAVDELFGE